MTTPFASVRRKSRSVLKSVVLHVLASMLVIAAGGESLLLHASLFHDVPPAHPHERAITWMEEQGLVRGYNDGTFAPEANVNRAEFVRFVISATGLKSRGETCLSDFRASYGAKAQFLRDVDPGSWYEPDVCVALEKGIVTGYDDKSFRPERSVSFVEAAAILSRAYGITAGPTDDKSPWYRGAVEGLSVKNAIPLDVESFDFPITRGIVAEMLYRVSASVGNLPSLTYDKLQVQSSVRAAAPSLEDPVAELIALINAARWRAGAPAIRLKQTLTNAAKLHADDMATFGYFSHYGRDGSSPPERMKAAGYESVTLENCQKCVGIEYKYGEIMSLSPLAQEAFDGFMESEIHRPILLSPDFDEVGAAFNGLFVVDFARTIVSY